MNLEPMSVLSQVAYSMLNVPYIWGGKNPVLGLDCSGLINVLLKTHELDIPGANAQHLYDHFSKNFRDEPVQLGTLLFYGTGPTAIHHIAMALNGCQMIEAGGGDSACVSVEMAKQRGACVKITPLYHHGLVASLLPHYLGT